jgi:hypothetical protein
MIEAKYTITAKELDKVYDMYWKYGTGNFAKLPFLGALLLVVYLMSIYISLLGLEMLFLFGGLFCFIFPMAAKTGLKKSIKNIAGKNITLAIDDKIITIKTEGLEIKTDLNNVYESLDTKDGTIISPMQGTFYWLPKNSLNAADYAKAQEFLAKSIKKIEQGKSGCGCCSCG